MRQAEPALSESPVRRALILLSFVFLSACGFHPRAQLELPAALGPVAVRTSDPYSPLGLELATALERAGVAGAVEGQPSAALRITAERWRTAPLSVDQFARVREYVTRYWVDFQLADATGAVLVAPQTIELSREYSYDINASAGSPAEQELIQRELRRDMQAAILRRLDIVLRARP